MSNRNSNRNRGNIENIITDYLFDVMDGENDTENENNVNVLSRIFNAYQRNQEVYNQNISNLIELMRINMNTPVQPILNNRTPTYNYQYFNTSSNDLSNNRAPAYNYQYFNTSANDLSNNANRYSSYTPSNTAWRLSRDLSNNSIPNNFSSNRVNNREIYNSILDTTYSSEESETRCPISLEDFYVGESICKITSCGHIFKREAIYQWLNNHNRCPVCRGRVNSSTHVIQNNLRTPVIQNNINDYAQTLAYNLLSSLNTNTSNITRSYIFDIPIYYDMSGNIDMSGNTTH